MMLYFCHWEVISCNISFDVIIHLKAVFQEQIAPLIFQVNPYLRSKIIKRNSYFSAASPPESEPSQNIEGRKNYDAVVYSVGTALVLVIILAFLRGFYRLKLDRKRSVQGVLFKSQFASWRNEGLLNLSSVSSE